MFKMKTFSLGPFETNAYLLYQQDSTKAIIIDPGMNPEPLIDNITDYEIEAILLTHAHFDHMAGVDQIRKLKNCPVYLHSAEADWLTNAELNGSTRWSEITPPITTAPADYFVEHGQVLSFLGEKIQVLHTPGHSPGSVSYLYGDTLFGGDVLFRLSVGRTDLPGGSTAQLQTTIHEQFFKLDGRTLVYPGHGPETTIAFEKEHNPYV